jgi:hypothetical protein
MRRFPPPVEALDGGFKIVEANGQTLAYVYGHADQRDAQVSKALRRIASNIAKLPKAIHQGGNKAPCRSLWPSSSFFVGQGVGVGYPVRILDSGSSNVSCRA